VNYFKQVIINSIGHISSFSISSSKIC